MRKENLCITKNFTILETIDAIKNSNNRGVIVLNEKGKVCGFVSQGDILEALIQEISLYSSISNILRPNFYYSKSKNLSEIFPYFRDRLITVMPIVDDDFVLKDIVTLKDIMEAVKL